MECRLSFLSTSPKDFNATIKPFLQLKKEETGGTLEDILQYILMAATIILAFAVIEMKNLLHAAIAFCGMCITIGGLFWLLDAPYAAVFQVLVYAGAVVTIFLAAVMFTTRKESMK